MLSLFDFFFLQSYESKGFWVLKNNENANEEEDSVYVHHHQPREDAKRPYPWFNDSSSRSETFPNKKQAVVQVQDPGKSNVVGLSLPLWETSSVFQSVSNQFMDRLLGTEMPRPLLFGDRDSRTEPKSYMEDRSVELSISNGAEVVGSCFGGGGDGGSRKLQVSRVKETMSATTHGGLIDGRKMESSSIRACGGRENESSSSSSSFVNFAMEGGHPYGNEEDTHGITFGEELNGVGSGNYQSYVQDPDMVYGQETAQTNSDVVSEQPQVGKQSLESFPKSKTSKKEASTSFPSNVRSLISTGMLDGVPVKYVSLSREVKHPLMSHLNLFLSFAVL